MSEADWHDRRMGIDVHALRAGVYRVWRRHCWTDLVAGMTDTSEEHIERLARVACFASECCWSRDKPCSGPAECDTFELEIPVIKAILAEQALIEEEKRTRHERHQAEVWGGKGGPM